MWQGTSIEHGLYISYIENGNPTKYGSQVSITKRKVKINNN